MLTVFENMKVFHFADNNNLPQRKKMIDMQTLFTELNRLLETIPSLQKMLSIDE